MKQYKIFVALGLSGLISVCSATSPSWVTNKDGDKKLVFTSTNDVFTLTPNPMTLSSGNYKITTDGDLERFSIVGSFVIDGGHLTINPKGNSKIYTSSGVELFYIEQTLSFKSPSSLLDYTEPFLSVKSGFLNFVFEGINEGSLQKKYTIALFRSFKDLTTGLLNDVDGVTNFTLKKNSEVTILGNVENRGEMNINTATKASFQGSVINKGSLTLHASGDSDMSIATTNSGVLKAKYENMTYDTHSIKSASIITTTGEGKTTIDINNSYGKPVDAFPMTFAFKLDNSSAKEGSVIFNINNSGNFLLSLKSSDATQKQVATLVNYQSNTNSTLEFASGVEEMRSAKVTFSGSNNKLFFFNFDDFETDGYQTNESNILGIKNIGSRNFISFENHSASYKVHKPSYKYWISPIESSFYVLTIGKKGDNTTGLEGSGLNFIVKANPRAPQTLKDKMNVTTLGGDLLTEGQFAYADKVVIYSSVGNKGGSHNLGVSLFDPQDAKLIFYTPKNGGGGGMMVM